MRPHVPTTRKVTISLPPILLEFADRQAEQLRISRSEIIGRALAQAKAAEEEKLAAEGYQFYSQEATMFAEASVRSFAEVFNEVIVPPIGHPRAGWDEQFKLMAKRGDDRLLDAEAPSLSWWDVKAREWS